MGYAKLKSLGSLFILFLRFMRTENKVLYFLIPMVLTAVVYLSMYFYLGPLESSMLIHQAHNPFLDGAYTFFTKLGEWLGVIVLLVVLLINRAYIWIAFSAGMLGLIGLVSYLLKIHLYPNSPRPRKLLANDDLIHMLEWIHVNSEHSFPSGHTLMAVTCATILAFYFRSNYKILLALWIFASLAGLSRVYLFQHFFIDVGTSILIALFLNSLFIYLFRKRLYKKYETV